MELKKYLDGKGLDLWQKLTSQAQKIVIISHVSPDGDAMGSTLALSDYMKRKGKEVHVVMPNTFPDFLNWLPGADEIINFQYDRQTAYKCFNEADLLFCLDFNDLQRLENMTYALVPLKMPKVLIDHHLSPTDFASLTISDPQSSSTCEILFNLLMQIGGINQISVEAAKCVYCGMMTDTGGFTYNSTRPEIFHIISLLLTKGIDKDKIYRAVYHNYSLNRMQLEGYILYQKLQYFPEAHTSLFSLTREEMARFQFKKGDAEGLVNLPLQIKGTKLSISLREDTEKPLIRVSLRSVDDFPCNRMSNDFFNGGGHLNASGGSLHMTMDEAIQQVLKAIEAYKTMLSATR